MPSTSPTQRTWSAGANHAIPVDLMGVRWHDGTVECRFRLLHPDGSLVAAGGDFGTVLTSPDTACTTCSDACAG